MRYKVISEHPVVHGVEPYFETAIETDNLAYAAWFVEDMTVRSVNGGRDVVYRIFGDDGVERTNTD